MDETTLIGPLGFDLEIEQWPMDRPFRISGHTFEVIQVVLVTLEHSGHVGRGEACGVYYNNDNPEAIVDRLRALRSIIEAGLNRSSLQQVLPAGGARNAVDCALWDLEAKIMGQPVWRLAGLSEPRPLLTTFTCGADEPHAMAEKAKSYRQARAIKLKLTGETIDADRVLAVREARGEVWLGVDANQGFTPVSLERLMPTLEKARVQLIEQPFPVGRDKSLEGFDSPIPIAADESVQGRADLHELVGRYSVVNIKLDKCGGLTEGLAMARAARALGLETMVGNMLGTSLSMAPSFLVGQLCQVVDLDGPILLGADRAHPALYNDGYISCPKALWG